MYCSIVFDGSVHSGKILYGAKENAAQKAPQQNGDPTENSGLYRAINRAGTRNRSELMTKNNTLFSGYIVHAVVFCVSGCFCFGVNTPFLGEPAPVNQIGAEKNDDCNQNDDNAIYNYSSLICLSKHYSSAVKTEIQLTKLTKRTNFGLFVH